MAEVQQLRQARDVFSREHWYRLPRGHRDAVRAALEWVRGQAGIEPAAKYRARHQCEWEKNPKYRLANLPLTYGCSVPAGWLVIVPDLTLTACSVLA